VSLSQYVSAGKQVKLPLARSSTSDEFLASSLEMSYLWTTERMRQHSWYPFVYVPLGMSFVV